MHIGIPLSICVPMPMGSGAPAAPPSMVSISPATGSDAGGDSVTLTGADFVTGATVTIGGVAATSVVFVNSTTITAVTPAGLAGPATVVVTNPDAQTSGTSGYNLFVYPVESLNIASISPVSGSASGGTPVTITGTGFTGALSAELDGVPLTSFVVVNDVTITGVTGAHAAGAANITVDGGGFTGGWTYVVSITSLSVAVVDPLGGDSVVITGMGFLGTTGAGGVKFGVTNATSYIVDSDTQITAVVPAKAAATYNVSVVAPYGTSNNYALVFWSPAVLAPQVFWDGGNYTIDTWATRSQAYVTNLDATSATFPTPASGNPDFIRANSDYLDPDAATYLQQVTGQDDMFFATVLDIDSISAQADDEKADGVITDHQMWLALLLGGAASNKAIFLYAQAGGDKKATITVPTSGRVVIIARKVSNVMQISINGGVAWTTGDTCTGGLGGHSAPIHLGWNRFATVSGAVGFFDGRMKALVAHNATISDANALLFYNWAASRHP